jgi:hydrogenase maturation protein HypF
VGPPAGLVRRRVGARVGGTVQGVGFRPFVFRLAAELALAGFVRNDELGVALEVEGAPEQVEEFLRRLRAEAPPLAAIEALEPRELEPRDERGFRILDSAAGATARAPVAPDVATCPACLAELFDPADRRFRYPFLNCTECGPRFTIVRAVPYDRATTTMAGFEMCARCRAEYEDPADRRFHAQPNACPECGPRARLLDPGGAPLASDAHRDAIAAAAALLAEGAIVAVKGVGGYHLACRAADAAAVATLRARKRREAKPFALLAADLAAARELIELSGAGERLLGGRERPIVLTPRRPDAAVADAVAPGCADLGLMLPHSPLHHLLAADAGEPLVLTSGNVAEEPIAYRDEDALRRLAPLADAFLLHDRPIHARAEDSVVRSLGAEPVAAALMLRRARGYAPAPLPLAPPAARSLLACGAELKSTFCLAAGSRCWLGPHVGDLRHYEALRSFGEGVGHFERLFSIAPELVAHDLHPDYLSTRYALEREGVETVAVQHHHAHLAACLAEHGVAEPAVGAIFDGAGYGSDGAVWGGEILAGDCTGFSRAGMLRPLRLPGGDAAAREPWRMACAWLAAALEEPVPPLPAALVDRVAARDWEAVAALAAAPSSPQTTSAGRLFDAVAALCGLRERIAFEGQAAIELEAAARSDERVAYRFDLVEREGPDGAPALVLDPRETLRRILADLTAGTGVGEVSARFHNGLAAATAAACAAAAEANGLDLVVLSGGVFQNRLLLLRTAECLRAAGLRVLIPQRLPPNDGGISYGQAAVAAVRYGS